MGRLTRKWFRRRKRGLRSTLGGALGQIRDSGFAPATVVDVGAAYGDFAQQCAAIFPGARYLLVEALEEYADSLTSLTRAVPGAEFVQAAAARQSGEITINVHGDLVGSSLYLEQEDSAVNGVPRVVRAATLDELCEERGLAGPFLLKLDVQGAELDVLEGAARLLRDTEYLLLEVSFFEFFRGGPLCHDVIAWMHAAGFVAYDLFGFQYRPLDGALSQADIAFVRENGRFRQHHYYATRAQREAQDQSLRAQHGQRGKSRAD